MRYLTTLILLPLLLIANPAYAEVYKWVDDNGKTHYSDKPQNKKSKKFEYKPKVIGQENFESNEKPNNKAKNKPGNASSSEIDKKNKKQWDAYNKEQKTQRKQYCVEAKQDLQATEGSNLLYGYNDKGERYFLNKEQRKQAIEKKKKIVKKWCG